MPPTISRARVVELTSELVAVPTHETEADAQQLLASWLAAVGFDCTFQQVAPGRPNLIAARGEGGPFLCSHIDCHPPYGHPDPFVCREEDGVLIGRGALDAKGQIAALVAAVEASADAPATIVVTSDEEFGGLGSERLELPPHLVPRDGGIVLEPTELTICTAQAGCLDLRLRAQGPSGHAHAPDGAPSALDVLLGAFDALDDCAFLHATHPHFGPARRHVGDLRAGEHLWRRPAGAEAKIALTLLPGTDEAEASGEVTAVLQALAAAWDGAGVRLTWELLDTSEAIEVLPDLPVVLQLLDAIGPGATVGGMPSWTDAANLLVHHGIPCCVFGAGDLSAAHSDREHVSIADLVRLAEILLRLLTRSS